MSLTTYDLADGIATITMADGKVNALSPEMLGAISADLDRAEACLLYTSDAADE